MKGGFPLNQFLLLILSSTFIAAFVQIVIHIWVFIKAENFNNQKCLATLQMDNLISTGTDNNNIRDLRQ